MTPEETKAYLLLFACTCNENKAEADCAEDVPVGLMRHVLKRLILRGQYVECALCNCPITNVDDLSLDHIVPHSKGGSNMLHNLQPTHRECNMNKGNNMTAADVEEACKEGSDTREEILDRKKKRKSFGQKKRNTKWLKPWEIDLLGGKQM